MDIPTPTECFNKKHCLAFVILNWLFTPIATQGYLPARDGVAGPAGFPARDEIKLMSFDAEKALAELKAHIEKTSEDVGRDFAREARAIHLGDAPSRAIRGEARPEEARKLVEDGVPIAPLPFKVGRKTN